MRECSKLVLSLAEGRPVQSCPEPGEGKAAAAWTGGAYGVVREHGQGARTPLAAFFNTLLQQPEKIVEGYKGRWIAQGSLSADHLLNVVYGEHETEIVVVTFYPGRKA